MFAEFRLIGNFARPLKHKHLTVSKMLKFKYLNHELNIPQ